MHFKMPEGENMTTNFDRVSPWVLLVESSKATRQILRQMLEELGYEVCEASCGQEALRLTGEHTVPPAAILTNWEIPDMPGPALVQELQKGIGAGRPLLVVSASTEASAVLQAAMSGADDYLPKPFPREVLADRLQRLSARV